MDFSTQLSNLKKLNLSAGQFLVVSSGALAVRGIREAKDIDVVVTQELWDELITKYPVVSQSGVDRVVLPDDIEILSPHQSVFGNSEIVPLEEMFGHADTFHGVKFINLEHLKKIKLKLGREKDMKDIELIDAFLNTK
ncbi:MAG: hypothetical protein WCK48_00640 [bacterium]